MEQTTIIHCLPLNSRRAGFRHYVGVSQPLSVCTADRAANKRDGGALVNASVPRRNSVS